MCLISQENTNIIDCFEKNIVNASTKDNCFVTHDKNEKFSQLGSLKRLTCLITNLKYTINLRL